MKNIFKQIAFVAFAAMVIVACSKKKDSITPDAEPLANHSEKVLQYIKDLGFPASSIVDNGNEYIVEEDILFPKNMEVPTSTGGAKTEQYYTGSIVNSTNKVNIRVFVDPSMTSMNSEITSAIAQWNGVAGSTLRFNIVTSGTYDILIKNEALTAPPGYVTCGMAEFPSAGKAGTLVRINKTAIAGNSFAQRARTICHELGHCISFRHTNWSAQGESSATNVPGVTGTDASSLMNGGQCNSGATVLSQKDKDATAALY
ncbi:M57 family metalloprotease [Pedobacter nototheniae]|uniref:M57 family metalloprotease n=1 Tax=Pedobacter nototheniae TaxID=2488994 RepID=UPI0029300494|nr:M57 family metalloprotease [Pedobacter nototheniae]